jgi:hypothetical protein
MAEPQKPRKVVARYIERRRKGVSRKTGIPYDTVDRRIAVWIGATPESGAPPQIMLHPSAARKALPSMDSDVAAEVKVALDKVPAGQRGGFDLNEWSVAQ